jgi:hypothetical protein
MGAVSFASSDFKLRKRAQLFLGSGFGYLVGGRYNVGTGTMLLSE